MVDLSRNDYPERFIENIRQRITRPTIRAQSQHQEKPRVCIPYCLGVSESIRRTLKPFFQVSFRTINPLQEQLWHQKDPIPFEQLSGLIYLIPCKCGEYFIGETGRFIQERIKEHCRDTEKGNVQSSAIAEHAWNEGHIIDCEGCRILDREDQRRKHLESFHISQKIP